MSNQPPSLAWHTQAPADPVLAQWLFDQDSLTQRLRQLSHDRFHVLPLQEGWQILRADECLALNCAPQSVGWVREVFLYGKDQPWVYARSVASQAALKQSGFDLTQLGRRSLGELLFSDPEFKRGPFEICTLDQQRLPAVVAQHSQADTPLWARRSCFNTPRISILVAEAFLPAFWRTLDHRPSTPVPE